MTTTYTVTLRRLRFVERHWDGSLRVGRLVITTEKQVDSREENAFRLGVDAGALGLVDPQRRRGHECPDQHRGVQLLWRGRQRCVLRARPRPEGQRESRHARRHLCRDSAGRAWHRRVRGSRVRLDVGPGEPEDHAEAFRYALSGDEVQVLTDAIEALTVVRERLAAMAG